VFRLHDGRRLLSISLTPSLLFALMRSNLLRQLPDQNGTILRLIKIATVINSIRTYLLEFKLAGREKVPAGIHHHGIKKSRFVVHDFIQGLVYTETRSIRTMGGHGLYYVCNR